MGEMAGGEGRDADDMDVALDGAICDFIRRREQGADFDIEAHVAEG